MDSITPSGMTSFALAATTAGVVTLVTALIVAIGYLIDRSAEHHQRTKDR